MTKNIVYLQCDFRFNNWLLNNIAGISVIANTIRKAQQLNCCEIVAGVYSCSENQKLIEILQANNVNVISNNVEDVNKRFLDIILGIETDYIIRVCGDQVLMDVSMVNSILNELESGPYEWFYDYTIANSLYPDIVSKDLIRKYYNEMCSEDRYFTALLKLRIPVYKNKMLCACFDYRVNNAAGYRVCKRIIEENINLYDMQVKLLNAAFNRNGYLFKTGVLESWLWNSVGIDEFFYDVNGEVNPWWNIAAVDFIRRKLSKKMNVFEWGSGNSTLFFASCVNKVISIEHDKKWYSKMKDIVPCNVLVKYYELEYGGDYGKAILNEQEEFDIVLIDGRDRVWCAINAVEKLKRDGVIIWDNSERERYTLGFDYLIDKGFKKIEIGGGGLYCLPGMTDYTAIFYRNENVLNL